VTRVVDKQATKIARNRHQRGVDLLNAIFGWDPGSAATVDALRRRRQATGPDGPTRATRKHWTRRARRAKTKAQRKARRRNRP
jgi:hypothetical protein